MASVTRPATPSAPEARPVGTGPDASRTGSLEVRRVLARLRPLTTARWWRRLLGWWSRSLPLRVTSTIFVASVVVLVLGGFLLMQQATLGVLSGKRESAGNEARQAINGAQAQLNATDLSGEVNVDKLLYDLAYGFGTRSGGDEQYQVIISARGQTITAGDATADSIPASLRTLVEQGSDLLMTPTQVVYDDGRPSVAGLVAGSALTLPGTGRYAIFLVFPLTQEVNTLEVLRYAVVSTGAVLVLMLTFITALVARQVVVPVRDARRAAENLASGNLHDRMRVRGQDDLARLATSMNDMAAEMEKQITTLSELSQVQQRFVSDVSHELRTPLTTVRMAAEVLHDARADFDPVSARSAELLQTELDRFESLLNDLLEISRFDAGAVDLTAASIDLRSIVDRVVEAQQALIRAYGVKVTVHTTGDTTAEVDPRRIERIVRNLMTNAIEHSEGRPVDVLLAGDEDAVAVAVRDHGVGFEASQAKQVFLRFWRADPARARTVGGTGLGLAISMEDANLHGGWLTAWGRPGLGAQFRLTVPRRAGGLLETSPLPMAPRDLPLLAVRSPEDEPPVEPVHVGGPTDGTSAVLTGVGRPPGRSRA